MLCFINESTLINKLVLTIDFIRLKELFHPKHLQNNAYLCNHSHTWKF